MSRGFNLSGARPPERLTTQLAQDGSELNVRGENIFERGRSKRENIELQGFIVGSATSILLSGFLF